MRKLFLISAVLLLLASCVPLQSIRYLVPDGSDSAKFENVVLTRAKNPFYFKHKTAGNSYAALKNRLDSSLAQTKTNVFLVIKNDTIIYQYLAEGNTLAVKQPSFSMAKSFVGTLVGMAIDRGDIRSTADLVIDYLPELAQGDERFKRLTIQHLLDMRSGFKFNERSLNPFSKIVRSYYGADLKKMVGKLKFKYEPNTVFDYQSINTQVLAFVLERATGKRLDVLFQENLWTPLGAESDALWSLDHKGHIKSFCCINATALDFAKLGRLYLKKGNWEGKQLVSTAWINATIHPDTLTKRRYKNQFWAARDFKFFKDSLSAVTELQREKLTYPVERNPDGRYFYARRVEDFKAQGMFNQSVYVNPKSQVIIVRLGGRQKKVNFHGFVQEIGRKL